MSPIFLIFIIFVCTATFSSGSVTEENIYKVLSNNKIPYRIDLAERAASEGLIKAIDPQSTIIHKNEMACIKAREPIASADVWQEGIYYLELSGIFSNCAEQVVTKLQSWTNPSKTGLIIDMRQSGGDNFKESVLLANLLASGSGENLKLENMGGVVVGVGNADNALPSIVTFPVVVLIGSRTTGASEAVVAALKGQNGVMLVGSKTQGDARIRDYLELGEDEYLYISTGHYIVSHLSDYGDEGVSPDVTVSSRETLYSTAISKFDIKDRNNPTSKKAYTDWALAQRIKDDPVMIRSVDILLGLRALGVGHDAVADEKDVVPSITAGKDSVNDKP